MESRSLEAAQISKLPKLDIQKVVLDYVKALRSYSKIHAVEGKAYVASWGREEEETQINVQQSKVPTSQSCGFATPVLKPRKPAVPNETAVEQEKSTRNTAISKISTPFLKNSQDIRTKIKETPTKRSAARRSKEPSTRRESRTAKRTRELQSDEEKRLQERREKKRTKREIMRPQPAQEENGNASDADAAQNRKSKKKQKLPVGLALMYGFSATNVGKNRLTVDPQFRSGVFGKGKASAPTQIRKSKRKGKSKGLAFSEEQFLKSAGRRRSGSMQSSSTSQSSASSSESPVRGNTKDDTFRQHLKAGKQALSSVEDNTENSTTPLAQKPPKKHSKGKKELKLPVGKSSNLPSQKAQSIEWDIERDSGLLPTDASSVPSCKSKSSSVHSVHLNIAGKLWMRGPLSEVAVAQELPSQAVDTTNAMMGGTLTARNHHRSPSVASSVRPSESPSQVIPYSETGSKDRKEAISKYFTSVPVPPLPPSTTRLPKQKDMEPAPPTASPGRNKDLQTVSAPQDEGKPSCLTLDFEELARGTESPAPALTHVKKKLQVSQGWTDSDWLLSDPVLNTQPCGISTDGGAKFYFSEEPSSAEEFGYAAVHQEGAIVHYEEDPRLPGDPDVGEYYENLCAHEDAVRGYFRGNVLPSVSNDDFDTSQLRHYDPVELQQTFSEDESDYGKSYLHHKDDFDETDSDYISSNSIKPEEQMCDPPMTSYEPTASATSESLPRFNEGRLLLGSRIEPSRNFQSHLDSIEADVVRHLVGHWLPQKF